jgi:hypothetical protein
MRSFQGQSRLLDAGLLGAFGAAAIIAGQQPRRPLLAVAAPPSANRGITHRQLAGNLGQQMALLMQLDHSLPQGDGQGSRHAIPPDAAVVIGCYWEGIMPAPG